MKKIAFVALASASVLATTPALASTTTGTINVTGTVSGRCSVIEAGAEKTVFSGTLDLGRLDTANGTLRPELTSSVSTAPAEAQKVNVRVVCTSANPTIGVSATKLTNSETTAAEAGYANTIDYVAAVRVNTSSTVTPVAEFKYDTAVHTSAQSGKLGARIAGGTSNNVEVNVSNLRTQGGAGNVLNQGTYNSVISVSIAPTV